MGKETRLVNKVKRLLRRLGCPRWLHHFGPKKYEFFEHFYALIVRFFCRLSYRRVKQLLDWLGFRCPSKSALQRTAMKLNSGFWNRVLKITCGDSYLVSIDSTGFSRTNPSYHYLKRIDGKIPKVPVKASIAIDTRKKKFCAAKIRVLPAHDLKDVKSLIMISNPKIVVADKAYDADWLHGFCKQKGIKAHIPIRNYGKPRVGITRPRHVAAKHFRKKTYHRREISESGNSSAKRKYGSSVSSKKARTIRTEIYGRLACHNIFSLLFKRFGTEPILAALSQVPKD
jgi:hypothetical protein